MNLFDLFAKISLDTSEYDSGVKDVKKSGSGLASKLKSGLASAGKIAAAGIGAITAAAGAAVGGLLALEQSTEEYRIAMGRLNTAFESAGYGADAANQAYSEFYGILGDTDRATEASQLLAKLADNEEDLAEWTNIAAGVNGTFGDSLPIESLIEAANETARTGTVVGTLADALNWAGTVGEDEFNAMLASCSSESERNQLIMETLAGTYDDAADSFYANNEALVASRNAQVQMDAVLSKLGGTVSEVKNRLMGDFLPAISRVVSAFSDMISGADGADRAFSEALGGLVNQVVSQLPQFLSMGVQILTSLASGIIQSIPVVVAALPQVIQEILSALGALLPQILNMGGQLLEQLANGIEAGLPNLVARLPVVIENILTYLTDNMPAILEKGVEILNSIVNGIVDSIPKLVAALPEIMISISNFVTENLPQIVAAGYDILVNLIMGIVSGIPDLVAAVPKLIEAIVTGFVNNLKTIVNVGKEIVKGIWQGITEMASWLKDQVTGFFSGIVEGVKDFLGIHSPSRVFADMGRNMALGLGEGWENEFGRIRSDIESSMHFGTANVDFASSGIGVASAGMVNGIASALSTDYGTGNPLTVNLVLPDGSKFATWQLPFLIQAGRAAGTPIANPQVG